MWNTALQMMTVKIYLWFERWIVVIVSVNSVKIPILILYITGDLSYNTKFSIESWIVDFFSWLFSEHRYIFIRPGRYFLPTFRLFDKYNGKKCFYQLNEENLEDILSNTSYAVKRFVFFMKQSKMPCFWSTGGPRYMRSFYLRFHKYVIEKWPFF